MKSITNDGESATDYFGILFPAIVEEIGEMFTKKYEKFMKKTMKK